MEKTIYYSVINGGDGSVYPQFMESMELAEWDQTHMHEGWSESCTGLFTVYSDSEITWVTKVETAISYFLGRYVFGYRLEKESKKFIEQFFPDGLPILQVDFKQLSSFNQVEFSTLDRKHIFTKICSKGETKEDIIQLYNNFN